MKKICSFTMVLLSLFMAFLFVLTTPPQKSSGYNTFNGHVLTGGVGNWGYSKRYYYISDSATGLTSLINSAMDHWIYTSENPGVSTPISFRRTYDQSSSVMDIFLGYFYDESTYVIGETEFYIYSTRVNPYAQNWGWANIKLNHPVFSYYLTNFHKEGTISHEMGHVMGLNDNNSDQTSVMCQLGYNRLVKSPNRDDLNGINALY